MAEPITMGRLKNKGIFNYICAHNQQEVYDVNYHLSGIGYKFLKFSIRAGYIAKGIWVLADYNGKYGEGKMIISNAGQNKVQVAYFIKRDVKNNG